MKINQISVNPSRVARVLGTVAVVLVVGSIAGQLTIHLTEHPSAVDLLAKLLYVDAEQNIPSAFSTFLLLLAALLLAVIAALARKHTSSSASHWTILSAGFVFMAVDEAWELHERLIDPVRKLLGHGNLGIFYYAWTLPGLALVLALAPFFSRFLFHLPAKTRLAFLVAATLYIGGAIGVEAIGGRYHELHGRFNLTYSMIATAEESLEMAGLIIFIWALLVYIADTYDEVRFQVKN
jgi:hypothetical protein